jgi:predicted RecA/RadA family phage recombinase
MKRLVLLSLLLFPIFLFAQYPTFSNKQKLGVQTTGDGLIFRGRNNPNYYTPNNINNAYFYLDTLTSKLYLYNISDWQQIYPTTSDTTSLENFLLKSDTLAMLLPYLRKTDTISLSNRINNKLSLADTASMLAPYLKLADTTSMLVPYFRDSDTTMLNLNARFNSKLNATDTVSLSNRINLKLNPTDTINLSNRIDLKLNKSDTISLSNRIDIKLNPSDTVSLSNRINKKLDTIYIQYQNYLDTIVNKDTINISNTLTEGFGINIIADSINIDSAVILATQQKQIAYVKNESGVTMYKGQAVYSSGSSGTNKLVTLASSSTEQTSSKTFGVVESESIPNGSHGYIITFGLLDKINTDNLTEGSSVYLSSTLGQLTTTKPQAPLHLVTIGVCIRRQQNNGSIFVKIQNGFELDEIHDVRITSPVNKASLYYNLSEQLWRDTTATLLVSDTASMLSKYVNTYSNQTNINGDKTFNNTVTIDSATVTRKLLVNTNISDAVKITSNTNSTNLELMNNSGTVYIKSSNKNMILQTDTTALVYLNGNNKKVGILTMNPQQELQVAGNVRIDSLNNNLVPTNLVGSSNNNDLTNVHLGEGLSFTNDTLKVDLTIIDTAIAASSITLVGNVSGSGSTNSTVNTTINNGVVTNDMLAGGISDSKLNTITTAGKVDNTATTATSSNTANTIVLRDNNRDFTARNITANNFYGLASTATLANTIQSTNTTGIIKLTTLSNAVLPIITVPDVNATMATTNLSQTFGGTQTFSNTITGNISGNAATVTSVTPSNFANQSANTVLAAPNGSSGTPTFRLLASTDIPNLNYLPLTGGILTGGLSGTTGTFNTRLGVGSIESPSITSLFTSGAGNQEVHFAHTGNTPGATVTLRLTTNLASLYNQGTYIQGIVNRGVNEFSGALGTNGSEYIRLRGVDDGGIVGVGIFNTNPSYNLDLTGTFRATGNSLIGGTLGVSGVTTLSNLSGGSTRMVVASTTGVLSTQAIPTGTLGGSGTINYIPKFTAASTIGNSSIFNNAIGDVGINDDTPSYKLDVNGTFRVVNGSLFNGIMYVEDNAIFYKDVTVNRDLFMNTSQSFSGNGILTDYLKNTGIKFYDSALGNMTIFNKATSSSFGSIIFSTGNSTGNANGLPTERMRISYEGNVGIGTSPTNTLDVNGTLRVRTTNTVTPSTILGRDVNGVVSGVVVGSGLNLSSGTLSLASSGGFVTTNSDYTVTITDSWIVFNNNFSNITVTLPNAATSLGRTLYFRNAAAGSIVSAGTANVINNTVTTGTPTNDILGAGNTSVKWCTLVSNGTYWIKIQGGSL